MGKPRAYDGLPHIGFIEKCVSASAARRDAENQGAKTKIWLPDRDSNPDWRYQKPVSYH